MHFNKDDEQRLMLELEAISRQSGYILPCSDTAPSQVSCCQCPCVYSEKAHTTHHGLKAGEASVSRFVTIPDGG